MWPDTGLEVLQAAGETCRSCGCKLVRARRTGAVPFCPHCDTPCDRVVASTRGAYRLFRCPLCENVAKRRQ